MASRLRGLFKLPRLRRRAKKTKGSVTTNDEEQLPVWKTGTQVIAKFKFEAKDDEDLSFAKGDVLVIKDTVEPGWCKASNIGGRIGLIPSNYVKENPLPVWETGTHVIAEFDREAQDDEDLSFAKGDVLVIENTVEPGWCEASNSGGRIGLIPSNYVKEKPEPGWCEASNSGGRIGLIPSNYVKEKPFPVWKTGTKVIGISDFEAEEKGDLSFATGDVLVIEDHDLGSYWSKARSISGRIGDIPTNYVAEKPDGHRGVIENVFPLILQPVSKITFKEAEQLLYPYEDGSFLVRKSQSTLGDFSLSVCYDSEIEHYRIKNGDDGKLTIDDEVYFESLHKLVEHFRLDSDGLCTRLKKPVDFLVDPESFKKAGWTTIRSEIAFGKCIRKGEFGDLFQAEYHGKPVSVKKYSADSDKDIRAFLEEAAIMTRLNHRNLVKLLGVSLDENPFYLVAEFCAQGNLQEFLRKMDPKKIREEDLVRLAWDVAGGMQYLESSNVVHRELMARNVLIHEDGTAKVSEFGLAHLAYLNSEREKTSNEWTAPEAIKHKKYSTQSDVWSYGVLLWVIFSVGGVPYSELPADRIVDKIEEGYRMECPKGWPTKICHIMKNCWDIDPKQRPTFKNICRALEEIHIYADVPLEIRGRGPLALKAYQKALSEGRACINRVPIMLIGQDRSGKTSLSKSLRAQAFDPEEDSTVGINVDPSYFKVSTNIWKPGEKDQGANFEGAFLYEHHAARLTVENLNQAESIPREESPESNQIENIVRREISVATSVSHDSTSLSSASDEPIASSCEHYKEDIYSVPSASTSNDSDSESESDSPDLPDYSISVPISQDHTTSDPELVDRMQAVPDDVASLIEVLLQEVDDVKREEDIYSVLWDFGGQTVYYTTHPLFLTPRAIYLLVNDLSRNPYGKAESVVKQGMFKKSQDSFRLKTNLDYLDFWMSSVASVVIQDESNPEGNKSDVLPEKLPPVFLVCTHADTPHNGDDPNELARMVFGHLQTKPYKSHLYDFFVVDNTKSGHEDECSEVVRLRDEIRVVAKELPQMKEAVPIKWLKFEKAIQATKETHKWIFFENAKQIACDVCNVSDNTEFSTLLNFLHDQRILIHFDDTPELNQMVVLDAQWLIDVFKEVITIRPYDIKEKKFQELWSRLEKEGILEESLLKHVWGPLYENEDTCESLIAIMEKFSLLCPWPASDGSYINQYLVPSMLMSHPPEDVTDLVASAQIPPIFLKFESGQVPSGLFPRLVLHFLQWCKQECESPGDPQLYHNFARIYNPEEENCSIILLCHMSFIEVVVLRGSSSHEVEQSSKSQLTSSLDDTDDTFACAVLRQLELMLESMRREFCWLQNMKYEVHFLCPVCCQGGAVSYCRAHLSKGCKQEECLHFWSESELCRDKKTICCTRSAVAKTSSISVKHFEPWFAAVRNQVPVGEHGDMNVAAVEGEEASFSGECPQLLLIEQRDDEEVVPQLKEIPQLEQACPPDSDSKRADTLITQTKNIATTEVSLPDTVEQSLLSPSCDAKEVVVQLKENLQLDQDALERPDPGTKAIIRSLARKAKDSERLDVFEHLRMITPSGTTGPLLPEKLHVLNMPVSKAREITIDLSGGEEWKELAEGLGLTPREIRFLDKRTLNPLDAALAFIAKQRYVSVGELYDLLTEQGFPVLADLL